MTECYGHLLTLVITLHTTILLLEVHLFSHVVTERLSPYFNHNSLSTTRRTFVLA